MRKRITTLVLVLAMIVGLVGCTGSNANSSDGSATASKDNGYIAVILMSLNQDYWHIIEAGATQAAEELGVDIKVVGPPVETDIAAQISLIEDSINSNCSGIVLAPTDPSTVGPALKVAKEKDIPVVTIDGDLAEDLQDLRMAFVGTSQYDGGKLVGEYIAENFDPAETKIGVIRGPLGAVSHNNRTQGCQDVCEPLGFEFLSVQDGQCDRSTAMTVAENMIEGFPEMNVIYCTNDEMAAGAYQGCVDKGRTDIKVVGFDGSPDCLGLIEDGQVSGTLAQSPFEMGYESVSIINDYLENHSYAGESTVFIDTKVIDQSSAKEYLESLRNKIKGALGECWF